MFGEQGPDDVERHGTESLNGPIVPEATYFSDSDCVEYVGQEGLAIHRRIDEKLTLILDDTRTPIGFKLKGFRNQYQKWIQAKAVLERPAFVDMVAALEWVCSELGDVLMKNTDRRKAYKAAVDLAAERSVKLRLPVQTVEARCF